MVSLAEQAKSAVTEYLAGCNGSRPSLAEALEHFRVDGERPAKGTHAYALRHQCYKLTTGSSERNDKEALRCSSRFAAWPSKREVPEWFLDLRKRHTECWNAFVLQIEHEAKLIRERLDDIALRLREERIGADEADKEREAIDWSPLNAMKKAVSATFAEAAKDPQTPFAQWLHRQIPVEQQRSLAEQLRLVLKKSKGLKGLPQRKKAEEMRFTLTLHFTGRNMEMGHWLPETVAENTYLCIGPQCHPPNHHGPRGITGKRVRRQMRTFTFYMPAADGRRSRDKSCNKSFPLDVLVPSPHVVPSRIKQASVTVDEDSQWSISLSQEIPSANRPAVLQRETRTFLGVDIGWRQKDFGSLAVVHSAHAEPGTYVQQKISFPLDVRSATGRQHTHSYAMRRHDERMALPQNQKFSDVLMCRGETPRESIKMLQQAISKKEDAVKEAVELWLAATGQPPPQGWQRAGKRFLSKMELPEGEVRNTRDAWVAWDKEANRQFARMHALLAQAKRNEYYLIAHKLCDAATDIGVEAKFVKRIAEKKLTKKEKTKRMEIAADGKCAYSPEKHVEEQAAYNRQFAAPAMFIEILKWVATKRGVRVHVIEAWMTTRRCFHCNFDNAAIPMEAEEFVCQGCGRTLHQDENAAYNLARLASECSGTDGDSRECSHDGKSMPYHHLAGMPPREPKSGKGKKESHSQNGGESLAAD